MTCHMRSSIANKLHLITLWAVNSDGHITNWSGVSFLLLRKRPASQQVFGCSQKPEKKPSIGTDRSHKVDFIGRQSDHTFCNETDPQSPNGVCVLCVIIVRRTKSHGFFPLTLSVAGDWFGRDGHCAHRARAFLRNPYLHSLSQQISYLGPITAQRRTVTNYYNNDWFSVSGIQLDSNYCRWNDHAINMQPEPIHAGIHFTFLFHSEWNSIKWAAKMCIAPKLRIADRYSRTIVAELWRLTLSVW